MSGKYQLLEPLGTGSTGAVYLARHQSLELLCAIKIVPKQSEFSNFLLSEAQLLKLFNHSSIPRLYDLEQDDTNFYLVEEYIDGIRLDVFLLQQSRISLQTYLHIIHQLLEIFRYLHQQVPAPVLYLDLKPEHILLCGDEVKLIDFSISTSMHSNEILTHQFGNLFASPPECIRGQAPTITTDIFCIGTLMNYLSNYLSEDLPKSIRNIINKSAHESPAERFETVALLQEALQQYTKEEQTCLSHKIAVIGSHRGCGSTFLSIQLTSILNAYGFETAYFEKNHNNSLISMATYLPFSEQEGLYRYHHFKGYPFYGPGILLPPKEWKYEIHDFGNDISIEQLLDYDLIIFSCHNAYWQREWNEAFFKKLSLYQDRLLVICNECNRTTANYYANEFEMPVIRIPYHESPFQVSHDLANQILQLLKLKGRRQLFYLKRKKIKNKKS